MSLTSIVLGFVATVAARRPDPKNTEIAVLKQVVKEQREILARERDQQIALLNQLARTERERDHWRALCNQAPPMMAYQASSQLAAQAMTAREMMEGMIIRTCTPGRASMFLGSPRSDRLGG